MAQGDWPLGTIIQLATGTSLTLTQAGIQVAAQWNVIQPSGRILWTPAGTPFLYTVDPTQTVAQELAGLAQQLANQEWVPVLVPQLGPGYYLYPPGWPSQIPLAATDPGSVSSVAAALTTS